MLLLSNKNHINHLTELIPIQIFPTSPNPQSNRHIISKSKYMIPIKSNLTIKVDLQSLQPHKFNSHSIPMLKYPHRNDQKILLIMENGCKLYFIFWWTHPWFNARMPQIFHHLLLDYFRVVTWKKQCIYYFYWVVIF